MGLCSSRAKVVEDDGGKPSQEVAASAQPAVAAQQDAQQGTPVHDSAGSTKQALLNDVRKYAAFPAPSPAAAPPQPLADGHADGHTDENERAPPMAAVSGPATENNLPAPSAATSAPISAANGAETAVANGTAPGLAATTPFQSPFQSPFAAANRSRQPAVRLALRSASVDAVTRQPPGLPQLLSSSGAHSDSFPRSSSGSLRSPALSVTAHADSSVHGSTIQSDGTTTVGTSSLSEGAAQPQLPPEETEQVLNLLLRLFDAYAVLLTLPNPNRTYIRDDRGLREDEEACAAARAAPFYAEVPLDFPRNQPAGSLAVVSAEARELPSEKLNILKQMADLVVREIEAKATALAKAEAAAAAGEEHIRLLRESMRFLPATVLIDTGPDGWRVHRSAGLSQLAGVSDEDVIGQRWDGFFQLPYSRDSMPFRAVADIALRDGDFVVNGATVLSAAGNATFAMRFKPAAEVLKSGSEEEAVAWINDHLAKHGGTTSGLYLLSVSRETARRGSVEVSRMASAALARAGSSRMPSFRVELPEDEFEEEAAPVEGIELGPLLGRGSYGRVYLGRWNGQEVAIKVCESGIHMSRDKSIKPWSSVEAVQSQQLVHPHVMRTFKHTTVLVQSNSNSRRPMAWKRSRGSPTSTSTGHNSADADIGGGGHMLHSPPGSGTVGTRSISGGDRNDALMQMPSEVDTWIIMEYCNRGSLQTAVPKGVFQRVGADGVARPNQLAILTTAAQLASAMAYVHSQGVIHGDLCRGNVLMTASATSPCGFDIKVADFGLSREVVKSRIDTDSFGTITHTPPELLREGHLSRSADVYAFGVLLWELWCSAGAWSGMSQAQVIAAILVRGRKLEFPPGTPGDYQELAMACMSHVPAQRPTFVEITPRIEAMVAALPPDERAQPAEEASSDEN